ncbi:hypothetical protein ACFCV3_01035 [Kribbella sp. NPDC056345]|uniref:hypothetical protein n=1 Tax=Kribbella sp. NPDC056345 TaxID=3345789 RepID=UPI0035E10B6A
MDELAEGVEIVYDRLPLVGDPAVLVDTEATVERLNHQTTNSVRGSLVELLRGAK